MEWHSSQRAFEQAIAYAKSRLSLDPLDEETHRQLMRLYTWSGRRPSALRQYKSCAAILEKQLGLPPEEETTQLHQAIQSGQPPAPPGEPKVPRPLRLEVTPPAFLEEVVPVERPVCVARQTELRQLGDHLDKAGAGQGRVVFVTGEAGGGKTTLIQEFSHQAQQENPDLVVAHGNCNAYTGIGDPYLPFRDILQLLAGDVQAQQAAGAMSREQALRLWNVLPYTTQALIEAGPDLLDAFVPGAALLERVQVCFQGVGNPAWLARLDETVNRIPASGMAGPQQKDLFEQYVRVIQSVARETSPLLLVVDDLQWADPGSISLLFHLGRHLAGNRILVVGAYRSEDVAIGRDGERHPLVAVVNEFQRDFGSIMVDLDQAESRAFVQALVDSEPNRLGPSFRQMLHQQTRGHPLYTIELLRGMQERGDLTKDADGNWIEGSALDWQTLPARVEAVIAERVSRLAQPLRAALRVASVEGEVFTAEVVARILATDEREMVGRLSRDLDRKHRLVRAQAMERIGSRRLSRYRFRNYLFQRYLYDSLDEVERTYLHEDVGSALEELNGGRDAGLIAIAPQLARQFEEAGLAEKAIHYLHEAGWRALQLSAYEEAISHFGRGLDLLMTLPDTPERAQQELALQLGLGISWITSSAPAKEVEEAYVRARELCQQMGETAQLVQALGGLSICYFVRAEHERAHRLATEALELSQQAKHPSLGAEAHWCMGFTSFALAEHERALTHLQKAIESYDPKAREASGMVLHASDARTGSMSYAALSLWCLGYPAQARTCSQEAFALVRQLDHPFSLADVLCFAGCFLDDLCYDVEALKKHSEELLRLATEMNYVGWRGTSTCYVGKARLLAGQIEEGVELIREGMAYCHSGHVHLHDPANHGALAQGYAAMGDPVEGIGCVVKGLEMLEQTGERFWEPELHRIHAALLTMEGAEADAEVSLNKAIAAARRQNTKSWELRATTSLARLWQKQGRGTEAQSALSRVYDWFSEGFDTADLLEAKALLDELA